MRQKACQPTTRRQDRAGRARDQFDAVDRPRHDGHVTLRLEELEDADRELLNAVQWDFPLDPRPYAVLGERLGAAEPDVRARVARVKELGVLRQLSAIFDTRALGYSSALVAAKVDPDRIDAAAEVISRHPGVSHNYKRNHAYNLWYTIAIPPGDSLDEHIDVLHRESGALVTRKLPTLELFKIGVKLDMTGQTAADAKAEVLEHERPERREQMPVPVLSDVEVAAIRVTQEDLPLVERPFAAEGSQIGSDEATTLDLLRSFKERKLMRRFAAVMNHRSAGYKANAMGVWAVPEEQLEELGPKMAGFAFVSHCYRRPTYEDWPYSVFTMVHGHNARDCEDTIAAIRADTGIDDYALLWSIKEYKKTRVRYFTGEWDAWRAAHLAATGA
jgi:siroheme decarboxylase